MKKGFCFLIITLVCLNILTAQSFNHWISDPEKEDTVLVGYGDRQGLQDSDFSTYFETEYHAYILNDTVCDYLGSHVDDIEITIILGTWCHDSQEQVPRFYKILDLINYDPDQITLIGVDRKKEGGDVDLSAMDIRRVPTFIFSRDGKELGRIIETPVNSLEEDMMLIIRHE
jgi:hypothetical protein